MEKFIESRSYNFLPFNGISSFTGKDYRPFVFRVPASEWNPSAPLIIGDFLKEADGSIVIPGFSYQDHVEQQIVVCVFTTSLLDSMPALKSTGAFALPSLRHVPHLQDLLTAILASQAMLFPEEWFRILDYSLGAGEIARDIKAVIRGSFPKDELIRRRNTERERKLRELTLQQEKVLNASVQQLSETMEKYELSSSRRV